MNEEQPKKKMRILDKILMGAVIGGAIGSVVGASLHQDNNKGSEPEKTKKRSLVRSLFGFFRRKSKLTKKIPIEK